MKWFIGKAVERFSYLLLTLFLFPHLIWAETLDIVIIGAGLTGTYTGWRLVENGRKNVHIFEGSDRIGGHLYTVFLPGMDHVPVELGAMEFFKSQKKVTNLVNYLQLPTSPFTTKDQNNLIYVRGKRFHEMDERKDLPYNLLPEERGKAPAALILEAIGKIDPKFGIDSWVTQKDQLHYKGQSLSDVSWQSFLLENLSPEAFQLLVDLEYVQIVADTSVANAVTNFLEKIEGEPQKLTNGFSQLPLELANRFQSNGGKIFLKHHLMSISYEGDKENFRYRLLFYQEDGTFKSIFTRHLILTISPPALKLLAQQSPALKAELFHQNLDFLQECPMTRLFLGYDYPWWQKLGLYSGPSLTTLPIRRCIYLESEEQMADGEKGNRKALICASSQELYTPFWSSFNESEEFAPGVGKNAVWQAEKQLEILHGVHNMPKAYTATFIDWSMAPHFGGSFVWKTGAKPEELMEYFQHPFVGEPLYVIGFAYSLHQNWIEGALESADALLKNYFFIKPSVGD